MRCALKVFDSAYVFGSVGGSGPGGPARATLFYALNLYQKAFSYFHMGLASAMAWLLFLAILVLTGTNFLLARRWVHREWLRTAHPPSSASSSTPCSSPAPA